MGSAILPWSFAQTVKLFSTGRMGQTADNMTVRECLQVENQSEEKLEKVRKPIKKAAQELYRNSGSRRGEKDEFRNR
jgi:hypothetical protein